MGLCSRPSLRFGRSNCCSIIIAKKSFLVKIIKLSFRTRICFAFLLFAFGLLVSGFIKIGIHEDLVIQKKIDINSNTLFVRIFVNNLLVILINISGCYIFGLTPIFSLISNGFFIGFWLKFAMLNIENWHIFLLKKFMPHSIEIIGIILSGAIGIKGVKRFYIKSFNPSIELTESKFEIIFSILIITLSALIEAYVSAKL
ncbi:MAG: stage II sporulation protein M [Candidatus Marinimicrobia bacterium]|nr:stage II sporulation protein M [Candidatus Neomarinimicrobiota bacterium]